MADNITERAIVPFNPASNTVLNKDKYNLYAPVAGPNKIGMAGFNPEDFNINGQIVSIHERFKTSITKAIEDSASAVGIASSAEVKAAAAVVSANNANDNVNTLSLTLIAHTANKNNPHEVTKAQIGLPKVENLSPAEMPVSDAQAIINASKVTKVTGKGLSTEDYTTVEKSKLSGIAEGAQVNTVTGIKGNAESTYARVT